MAFDPFTIVGFVIVVILFLFAGRIFSVMLKVFLFLLVAMFVLIVVFGISLDEVIDWGMGIVLWAV